MTFCQFYGDICPIRHVVCPAAYCDDRRHRRGVACNAHAAPNAPQQNAAHWANIVAKRANIVAKMGKHHGKMGEYRGEQANITANRADITANRADTQVCPYIPKSQRNVGATLAVTHLPKSILRTSEALVLLQIQSFLSFR